MKSLRASGRSFIFTWQLGPIWAEEVALAASSSLAQVAGVPVQRVTKAPSENSTSTQPVETGSSGPKSALLSPWTFAPAQVVSGLRYGCNMRVAI